MLLTRTSSIAIVLLLLFPVLLAPAGSRTAYAHAAFDRSEPAAGATIAASPAAVKVWFTETLADGSWLSVLDAQAQQADLNDSAIDSSDSTSKLMAVSLKSDLPVGVYTVKWKSVSADDGDNVTGEFEFSVGHGAPAPAPAPPTVSRHRRHCRGGSVRAAHRWRRHHRRRRGAEVPYP